MAAKDRAGKQGPHVDQHLLWPNRAWIAIGQRFRQGDQYQQQHDGAEYAQRDEIAAPAEVMLDLATDHRGDQRPHGHGRGNIAIHLRGPFAAIDVADHGPADHRATAGADALRDARADQKLDAGGHRADPAGNGVDDQPCQKDGLRPKPSDSGP